MARLIKETPILYGKDADNFLKNIEKTQKITPEEAVRISKNYDSIKNIAQF